MARKPSVDAVLPIVLARDAAGTLTQCAYPSRVRRTLVTALFFGVIACQPDPAPKAPSTTPSTTSKDAVPSPPPSSTPAGPTILRTSEEVAKHVGEVITIEGVVERSKQPTLLGVDVADVDSEGHDSRGKKCRATGRLEKRTLEVDPNLPISAHRSPGTYLTLVRTEGQGLAIPMPVP